MSDESLKHETHIHGDMYGQVHTGSGNINVYYQGQIVVLSEQEQQALLSEYISWQIEHYAYLPISGIPIPLNVDVPLDQVYIKLRALPQQKQSEDLSTLRNRVTLEGALSFVRRFGELQWQRYQETDARNTLAGHPNEEPILPEHAISNYSKVVIIGIPGSGKSTLLRHFVWEQANDSRFPIPLLIPLGRADLLMEQKKLFLLEAALEILTEHKVGDAKARLQRALVSAIERKQVRFLFDGLDEVHACKQQIVATLTALASDDNKIVVTSRPIGYERLEGFEHYEVLPLLPEDANSFSIRWFMSLAEARRMEINERQEWSTERGEWLKAQLKNKPSLREIARIPLLLTFLAILAGDGLKAELPRFRKHLYKEYVDRLFTTWEARRKEFKIGEFVGEEARVLMLWSLFRTAYALHSAYYGSQSKEQPTPLFVKTLLARELSGRWHLEELKAMTLAAHILEFWEQAGLLVKYRMQEEDVLAFRHLTFQEYGAARALAETEANSLWNIFQQYMNTPQWGELISLTLAHLETDECTQLMKQFIDADKTDPDGHRPLLLAINALADGAKPSDIIRQSIIDISINLAREAPPWLSGSIGINATTIFNALAKQEGDNYCFNSLITIANDENIYIANRILAAEAAGRISLTDDPITTLLTIAEKNQSGLFIQLWIARVFGRLGRNEDAMEVLRPITMSTSKSSKSKIGMYTGLVAETFAELGKLDEAIEALSALASNTQESSTIRIEAIRALRRIHQVEAISSLGRKLAFDDSLDELSRIQLSKILKEIGLDEEARNILVEILQDKKVDSFGKLEAMDALSETKQTLDYVYTFQSIVQDKKLDLKLRIHAVKMLSKCSQIPQAISLLSSIARDKAEESEIREEACRGLIFLGQSSEAERLLQNIEQEVGAMSLNEHLKEIRQRLLYIIFAGFFALGLSTIFFASIIVPTLSILYNHQGDNTFTATLLTARPQITIEVAFLLVWPFLIYQVYAYMQPGLIGAEKRIARWITFIAFSLVIYFPISINVLTRLFILFNDKLPPQVLIFWVNRTALGITTIILAFAVAILTKSYSPLINRFSMRVKITFALIGVFIWVLLIFLPIWVWIVFIAILFGLGLGASFLYEQVYGNVNNLKLIGFLAILETTTPSDMLLPRRNWVRKLLRDETEAYQEILMQLREQDHIPAEASWSLAHILAGSTSKKQEDRSGNLDKIKSPYDSSLNPLDIYFATDSARIIAEDTKQKPALRIRAAKALGNWVYQENTPGSLLKQMASILGQILSDSKLNLRLRNKCFDALQIWKQTDQAIEAVEKLVKDEQAPIGQRVWAMESVTIVATEEQASHFLDDIAGNPTISPRVRKLSKQVKQRAFADVPANLANLRNSFAITLIVQIFVFVALAWFFPSLVIIILHNLYGNILNISVTNYSGSDRVEIGICMSLFISLPLYIFIIFNYINPILLPSKKQWTLYSIIVGLLLLYPFSLTTIFVATHTGFVSNFPQLVINWNVWKLNRVAILPFLVFVGLISFKLIRMSLKGILRMVVSIWTAKAKGIRVTKLRLFVLSVIIELCLFLALFIAILIPLWIISTIITFTFIILIIYIQWIDHINKIT